MTALEKHKINVVISGGNPYEDNKYLDEIEDYLSVKIGRKIDLEADILLSLGQGYLILNDNWVKDEDTYIICLRTGHRHKIIDFRELTFTLPRRSGYSQYVSVGTTKFSCIKVNHQHLIRNRDKIIAHTQLPGSRMYEEDLFINL